MERSEPATRLASMRRAAAHTFASTPRRVAVAAALVLALGLAACGDSNDAQVTIPANDANYLLDRLDEVQSGVESGHCVEASAAATGFVTRVVLLPKTVGADAKEALRTAGINLQHPANDECNPPTGATGATGASGVAP